MKTLIISSSLSPTSKSHVLATKVTAGLKDKGVDVTFWDAREHELVPTHKPKTADIENLAKLVEETDNIIFAMGVHCYSVNDSLKMILDTSCSGATGKFFGILCAAGGNNSYLSTMHLTQICMNEWRMIQLPRIVYATGSDFEELELKNEDVIERIGVFVEEFNDIGGKLAG